MSSKLRILIVTLLITIPVDQLSKLWIDSELTYADRIPVVEGFFYITHVRNPGAAFGLFTDGPRALRMTLFIGVSLVAIGIVLSFYRRLAPGEKLSSLALGLILALIGFARILFWPGAGTTFGEHYVGLGFAVATSVLCVVEEPKDIAAIECDGHRNIPDGEVFTAPVRDSINGTIQYNTPTIYHGVTHENVRLVFKEGKVVEATSSQPEHLEKVLDTDEGSRYVGEFAIGFHPGIRRAMKDILFDEKIAGSIHLTPGNAYEVAFNGNRSQVHWDLVLIQRSDYGGGEIWFDGELIRKDGFFIPEDLTALNVGLPAE